MAGTKLISKQLNNIEVNNQNIDLGNLCIVQRKISVSRVELMLDKERNHRNFDQTKTRTKLDDFEAKEYRTEATYGEKLVKLRRR